jgi:hypothetical protein
MQYIRNTLLIVSVFFLFTALTGCKKNDNSDEEDTSAIYYQSFPEWIFNDILSIADEAGYTDTLSLQRGSCAVITNDTNSKPHLLTIDFGNTDCPGADDISRRGRIMVTYSGLYNDSSYTHMISPDNYFVNNNHVLGNITVKDNGLNNQGHFTYAVSVDGQIFSPAYASAISWSCNYTREWSPGALAVDFSDDAFKVTGTSSGTGPDSLRWTANIIGALYFENGCLFRYPGSGLVEITPAGKQPRTLDYGSGSCDKSATMTINGNEYNIDF